MDARGIVKWIVEVVGRWKGRVVVDGGGNIVRDEGDSFLLASHLSQCLE